VGGTLVVTVGEGVVTVIGARSGFRELGAGGVDPPLAAATLDSCSPNLTGTDGARKFGVCWENRAGARVDVAACK